MKITSPEACHAFLVDYLKAKEALGQITILGQEVEIESQLPLVQPLMVVLEEKREVEPLAFQDYLGERFDQESNRMIEVRGRLLQITYQLQLWNEILENNQGEAEADLKTLQQHLEEIFAFDEAALKSRGINLKGFNTEKIVKESTRENLLKLTCQLKLQLFWEKEFIYEMVEEIIPHTELKREE
ncbi:hypothetical protein [Alkaliphilus crotonatoxidans]